MNAKYKHIIAAALGALLITGAAPAAGPAKSADQRAPLVLLDAERHIVLEEMRNFLAVLQTITDALTREDMKEIARAARTMGSGAANEIPPPTVAKLPEEFKVLAGGVHTSEVVVVGDGAVVEGGGGGAVVVADGGWVVVVPCPCGWWC